MLKIHNNYLDILDVIDRLPTSEIDVTWNHPGFLCYGTASFKKSTSPIDIFSHRTKDQDDLMSYATLDRAKQLDRELKALGL
jgi:hypothetical protein